MMTDSQVTDLLRSHYGMEKMQDHNYQNWSFQCSIVLSEKKVWKVVTGEHLRPPTIEQREIAFAKEAHATIEVAATPEEADKLVSKTKTSLSESARAKYQKEIDSWDEKDEGALRIISFNVSDLLQASIRYGKASKGAWDELKRVQASSDM
jgi:hypothetical protein